MTTVAVLIRQVRVIELKTRRLVDGLFSGLYLSSFKGRGIEFDEVREYVPGDDVRSIDWNVTARTGRTFIKRHVEERELTVMLLVDISGSTAFGTAGRPKRQLEAEICSTLAFSALRNNDRVGLLLFSGRVERFIPPGKGRNHVLRMVRELLVAEPRAQGTDVAGALDYVNRILKGSVLLFVVSDFRSGDFTKQLRITARRHDMIALQIEDPGERNLPSVGLLRLQDAETGQELVVDLRDERVRQQLTSSSASLQQARRDLFRSLGVDAVTLSTDQSYVEPLTRLFEMRLERRR
jgi:uncharacterized protein (DUF58 family)